MKKVTLLVLMGVLIACLGIPGTGHAQGTKIKMKWAHIFPTDSDHHKRSEAIAKEVYEKTKGRIEITVYPAGQLGDWLEQYEQLMRGSLEAALVPVSGSYDPRLNFVYLPYLDISYESAKKTWDPYKGPYYKILHDMLFGQNIKLAAIWPQGLAGIAFNKDPKSPGDPNVPKGIKIRAPALKAFEVSAEVLGYIPTPLPLSETFTAIQTGVVDGESGGGPYQAWSGFRDVTKVWVQYNDYFEVWAFAISLSTWNSLSKEDQQILQEACIKQQMSRFDYAETEDKMFMDKLRAGGVKIVVLTPAELKACSDKMRKEGWPKLESIIGKSIMDQIKAGAGVK